jgi:decaprenylphospho-beta-D-ribofuranose 2-oxidase
MKFEKKIFFSFDKNYSADIFFRQPDKYIELEKISRIKKNFTNMGTNLSYSPLCFGKDSIALQLKKFNRILNFDLNTKEITVESGLNLAELLNFTLKYNLWIPQLPGYPLISVGGAVASNAHGKSCAFHGTIRNSIKRISLFHKDNGWLNLSKKENKEIFDLTIGGLGLTGTIVNITFELEEIKNKSFTTNKTKVLTISDCIKKIREKSDNKSSFTYSWNRADSLKNLGKGIIFENSLDNNGTEKTQYIPEKLTNKFTKLPFSLWNNYSIKFANLIFFHLNYSLNKNKKENFLKVIFPFYGNENYFNFFGKKGFIESQLLISEEKITEFFDEFKYLFKLHKPSITLFSFKNMSGEQKFLRFEDNKICVTIDYINDKKNKIFMEEIDKICIKLKILPSIIKDSRLSRNVFEKCYQYADNFRRELYLFDKNRVYKSETSHRLEL